MLAAKGGEDRGERDDAVGLLSPSLAFSCARSKCFTDMVTRPFELRCVLPFVWSRGANPFRFRACELVPL